MSYGNWNARSPEDVQRYNGVKTDFNKAVKRYESIRPLQGKRKALDVRPSGQRDRAWERIVKVSDTEYYLTNSEYGYRDRQILEGNPVDGERRAITLKQEGEVETIIIHKAWYSFTSPSVFYFYDYNLPQGMDMQKYRGSNYVRVLKEDGGFNYYRVDKIDTTFYRPKGGTYWTPLTVYKEVRHKLNRTKTKAIREKLKTFTDYARVMLPLVEPKWNYSSVLDTHWESFVTLKNPNEIPESWLTAVSHYAQKLNRWSYNSETKQGEHTIREKGLASMIQREAYRAAKPFDVEPVPLGELSYDSYRNWVNN
jgi:hypothetical protein